MHRPLLLAALAGFAISPLAAQPQPNQPQQPLTRYDGHRSVRVTVQTQRELMTVLALTEDVLTCEGPGGPVPVSGPATFDVRFSPEQYAAFLQTGLPHEVLIQDLQAHIDAWKADNERIRALQQAPDSGGWYDVFRNLAEIETRLANLAAAHPAIATPSIIGQSIEDRPIRMIRITGTAAVPPASQRPALVINGTQHSRESLSPMTTMYFLEQLLTGYGSDPRITALLDNLDFYIMPVINPDGYEYVWTSDPLWRKNRRINPGSNCRGIDLNRNWGYQWGQTGSSGDPCSETFRGAAAFSEPETEAIRGVIDPLAAQGRFKVHMDIHSYATKLLSPWGYTTSPPPDFHTMNALGQRIRDAIVTHRGTLYQYGQGSVILYVVSGGSRDYSYGVHGAMGWTIELPGTSFHPPASEILPVAQETHLGLLALAEFYLPPAPQGACCLPTGCILTGPDQCAAANGGGIYFGNGSACGACPTILSTGIGNAGMTNQGAGIFLDLTSNTGALQVPRIDMILNSAVGTAATLQVWTRPGTYVGFDTTQTGWTLHDTVQTVGHGDSIPTPLPLTAPLTIAAGETVGVYLIAQSGGIRYTSAGAQPTWSDGTLTLFSNRARTAPWGGSLFTPRTFAGRIHYTPATTSCYANCDGSTLVPILNVADFGCFLSKFAAGDPYANCDQSTTPPILNVADFGCFLSSFALGCN